MVATTPPEDLRDYPAELIQLATEESLRDADDVVEFLATAGLAPPPGEARGFDPSILLDLGAVVRLRRWEAAGYSMHFDAGLPSAHEALQHVIQTLLAAARNRAALAIAGKLARAVFDLSVSRHAWTARSLLGCYIVVDLSDEDALVEALSQFLWSHRHDNPTPE